VAAKRVTSPIRTVWGMEIMLRVSLPKSTRLDCEEDVCEMMCDVVWMRSAEYLCSNLNFQDGAKKNENIGRPLPASKARNYSSHK
jgi:hypothetical protein